MDSTRKKSNARLALQSRVACGGGRETAQCKGEKGTPDLQHFAFPVGRKRPGWIAAATTTRMC